MSWTLLEWWREPEQLRTLLESYGGWGPLCFIALQALQVILAPIPGEATGLLAGYFFGPWWGLFYAMLGLILGSSAAFAIARLFRAALLRRFAGSPYFQRFSLFMARRGILAAFVCFLIPGFPKDYLAYFLGFFPIPWPVFLFIMTLGRLPATLALTLQGAALYEKDWRLLLFLTIVCALFFGVFYLLRTRLYQYLEGNHARRLS